MRVFNIKEIGLIIRRLLVGEDFDKWQFIRAKIQKANTFEFDGQALKEFYDGVEEVPEYILWEDIKQIIYEVIRGKKLPLYMIIVIKENIKYKDDKDFGRILNFTYKDGEMSVSSGMAYNVFSLDKSNENIWDDDVQNILNEMNINFEIYD